MADHESYVKALEDMRASFSGVRQVVKAAMSKNQEEFDVKDGISLLSLKNDVMLSYTHSLVLLSCHRILGHSLLDRSPPIESFASTERTARGADAGDLVDHAVEARAVLEKTRTLESRMKYQIDKLVRLAEDTAVTEQDISQDPLIFRPNAANLVAPHNGDASSDEGRKSRGVKANDDGVYRPPKLAPVPYLDEPLGKRKKARVAPVAKALSSLAHLDPSMPHLESTSGLGGGDSTTATSAVRARLDEMARFEEDNMTRLLLNKKETSRRRRDEGDIALGGMGGGTARGGGLEDEFADVLKAVGRNRASKIGDGYDELRQRGKKADVLSRSRVRGETDDMDSDGGGRARKRGKFEKDVAKIKRKSKSRG